MSCTHLRRTDGERIVGLSFLFYVFFSICMGIGRGDTAEV